MMRLCRWCCLGLIACYASAGSAEPEPLRVGLVPNVSARTLLSVFQPMREYLMQTLNQPVEMSTAPDFATFYQRTQRNEFDVIVTPAHFAWLAMNEASYAPILTYQTDLRGLLIVAADSPIKRVEDLRGKKLGIVDPTALVTLRGLQWLREHGLRNTDFSVRASSAHHNSVALAVVQGEIDAAIIGSGPYRFMPENIRAKLRVVSEVAQVPNAIYLVRRDWSSARRRQVQQALLSFGNESAAGREFMKEYRYEGFKPMTAEMLKPMEPYALQAQELMQVK